MSDALRGDIPGVQGCVLVMLLHHVRHCLGMLSEVGEPKYDKLQLRKCSADGAVLVWVTQLRFFFVPLLYITLTALKGY